MIRAGRWVGERRDPAIDGCAPRHGGGRAIDGCAQRHAGRRGIDGCVRHAGGRAIDGCAQRHAGGRAFDWCARGHAGGRGGRSRALVLLAVLLLLAAATDASAQGQNPSPMVENTRAHERLSRTAPDGISRTIAGPGGRDVEILVPSAVDTNEPVMLVIHFHGAAWIAGQSVARLGRNAISVTVNVGSGSMVYDRTFSDPAVFTGFVRDVVQDVAGARGAEIRLGDIVLTGFSAGHGAIRAILRDSAHFESVDAVLLLDGMHTSYVPEGTVVADGGTLDTGNLEVWAEVAREAIAGRKRFMVTHSEIFPGTFASTTETADWLLDALGVPRTAVLEWGPRGLQQLSHASAGGFEMLGYAGNSAPDHVDQLHAMPELLARLLR